jgi:hypothetical protein
MEYGQENGPKPERGFLPRGIFLWAALIALIWAATALIGSRRIESRTAVPQTSERSVTKPPLMNADVLYLQYPVNKTVAAIQGAQAALASQPPDVQASQIALDSAYQAVAEMTGYYLPLTEARDHLVRAYWEHLAGQNGQRDEDLAAASNQLAWVVENTPSPAQGDAEELLTLLNSLELHKQTDQTFARTLSDLIGKMQMHLRKASLKLEGPDASPGAGGAPASKAADG